MKNSIMVAQFLPFSEKECSLFSLRFVDFNLPLKILIKVRERDREGEKTSWALRCWQKMPYT